MRTAIIGNGELDIKTDDLYRFAKNCTYPHPLDYVITTASYGVAESARTMARERNILLYELEPEQDEYDAIDLCEMAVIIRKDTDYPYLAQYCDEKGRLFKEYVVQTNKAH